MQHHQLLDEFARECGGAQAAAFLRHVYTVEGPEWRHAHHTLLAPDNRSNVKVLEKKIRRSMLLSAPEKLSQSNPAIKRTTSPDWLSLSAQRFGRPIPHFGRMLFFSALVPFMTWKRGSPNWTWLTDWVDAVEGHAPGDSDASGSVRTWWRKSISRLRSEVAETKHLAAAAPKNPSAKRRLQHHLLFMQALDGGFWAYIRFARLAPSQRRDSPLVLPSGHIYTRGVERDYVQKGLVPVFRIFREQEIRKGCYQLLPKVQHAGLK